MKTNCLLAFTALLVTAAGCTTYHPTPAPTLHTMGTSLEQVKTAVVRVYQMDGWMLDKDLGPQLVFMKEVNDRAAEDWYGASPDNPVFARETITFTQAGNLINGKPAQEIVLHHGMANECTDPVTTYEFTVDRIAEIEASLDAKLLGSDNSSANFAFGQ